MKLVLVLIAPVLIISNCKHNNNLASNITSCPLLPVKRNSQTLFFDVDPSSDTELKSCILKNSHSDQSILLTSIFGRNITMSVNTQYSQTSDIPNVVIFTKALSPVVIFYPTLKLFIKSHWSLLYIIVTSNSDFKCVNGTMNTEDFVQLENIMKKMWHKFRIMRIGVVFPFACKQKMVIYNGKRPSNRELYDRPIQLIDMTNPKNVYSAIMQSGQKLFNQYPMQASIFHRYPTAITNCSNIHYYRRYSLNLTAGFCGMDGMVMHDVLSNFKFNVTFPNFEKCANYGYVADDYVTGSLGCIIRKELDISFNSRFLTLYADENVYYLHYVTTDTLCALVKNTDVIPLWHSVLNVYEGPLWLLIATVVVTIGVIMWATAIISETTTGEKKKRFWFYLSDAAMSTMFGVSLRKDEKFVILRGTCLLSAILFGAVYQGHINHVYTTLERFERIKTLEQLYKSGATLYTSASMKEFIKQLQNPEDKLQIDFFNKLHMMPGERLDVVLQYPRATTLDRKFDVKMQIHRKYLDKYGIPLIDIVDECFYTYYLSYITRSGFPFFEDLQLFIERLREAGLPTLYYKWTQRMLGVPESMPILQSEPRPFSKIRLQDQRVAFGIMFIGQIASVIVFITELWWARRCGHNFKV